jgi:lipopolysaccharide/colanic/teichoic acid biosynthesis glycosyltransferase
LPVTGSAAASDARAVGAANSGRGRRAFDLAVTFALLPFALALGAVVAVAVLLDSHGPVFYRSRRIGRGGAPFEMLKFRTMRHDAVGPPLTAHGDERQTPIGRFLAGVRLDELPQLWNVLKGDMRLVGPRPEVEEFVLAQHASYRRILTVPPGLTGPTQLAFADEGALLASVADRGLLYREEILPAKVRLDLEYVESSTLLSDLRVVALTCVLPLVRTARRIRGHAGEASDSARALGFAASTVGLFLLFVVEAGGSPW